LRGLVGLKKKKKKKKKGNLGNGWMHGVYGRNVLETDTDTFAIPGYIY